MVRIIRSLKDLNVRQLMDLYGATEQDFYTSLIDFYSEHDAYYAVLLVDGRYLSAVRVELYRDGWIVAGLQTAHNERNKGYAKRLLTGVLQQMPKGCKVYSHVDKRNAPSFAVHVACGFEKILDHAVYLDGSVSTNALTLMMKTPAP